MRAFGLILLAVSVLVNPAWADMGGRITGTVADSRNVFVAGAAITLTDTNNGTKRTARTNDEGNTRFL